MSEWYEADNEGIDINKEEKQVSVYVKQNDFGSVYVTLTFDQIRKLSSAIAWNTRNGE